MPPVADRPFVHFTHVENLAGIISSGWVKADSVVRAENITFRECGNIEIKERRRNKDVPVEPYGKVSDYVPFYFAPRSPMLYSIHRGNVPSYTEGQAPLVHFWSDLVTVHKLGLRWVASDGNSAHSLSYFTNTWVELEKMVDWNIMNERYWRDTEQDGDRMRRRMAEFLVYGGFPAPAIKGIVVMSDDVAQRARNYVPPSIPVYVDARWYY